VYLHQYTAKGSALGTFERWRAVLSGFRGH